MVNTTGNDWYCIHSEFTHLRLRQQAHAEAMKDAAIEQKGTQPQHFVQQLYVDVADILCQ